MNFLGTLAQSETQTTSFTIWTRGADFIFYDNKRYAKQSN